MRYKVVLHRTYISDVERGARNLSLQSIDKLASALQISISSLFTKASSTSSTRRVDFQRFRQIMNRWSMRWTLMQPLRVDAS
ncbi:MAG TPA: helix-turn-helix transcriptional regulator [Verrucomicrobiae bacterium]